MYTRTSRTLTWWQIAIFLAIGALLIAVFVLAGIHEAEEREAKRRCVREGGRPIEFNCRSTVSCVGSNHTNCTSTRHCEWVCDRPATPAERP